MNQITPTCLIWFNLGLPIGSHVKAMGSSHPSHGIEPPPPKKIKNSGNGNPQMLSRGIYHLGKHVIKWTNYGGHRTQLG